LRALIFLRRLTTVSAALAVAALAMPSAHAQLSVLINPGDQGEASRFATFSAWKTVVDQALRKEKITAFNVAMSTDATADLGATRSGLHDLFVAPAHVLGSAVRYGYRPVAGLDKTVQAVLVAPSDSTVGNLADAAGKRLGLPLQDSLVTYLVRGETNAGNTTIKRHFASVYESRHQDALLVCLQIRKCDVVAVERVVYERWVASGAALKIVLESKAVPGLAVAVKTGAPAPSVDTLRAALMQGAAAQAPAIAGNIVPVAANAFEYVSTLGYFTPRLLPGANVVDAPAVQQLLSVGSVFIDTRTEAEFKAGHVPGAKLVPYVEKSAKDADFDASQDKFDLGMLPKNKNAALVFACNGAECWKSFKASHAAIKAGHTKVNWFRGGFPEWRGAGLKIDRGGD